MQVYIKWGGIGGALIALLIIALLTKNAYLKFVDNYEIGYWFNTLNGTTTVLPRTGWFGKKPFIEKINTIDLRPFQTCINANQRVLNCKLVRFNPQGLPLFISWHGRRDYTLSFSSRSSSSSSSQASGDFEDIMRSYAYDGSGRSYPFLTILRELKNDEPPAAVAAVVAPPAPIAPQSSAAGAGQ